MRVMQGKRLRGREAGPYREPGSESSAVNRNSHSGAFMIPEWGSVKGNQVDQSE